MMEKYFHVNLWLCCWMLDGTEIYEMIETDRLRVVWQDKMKMDVGCQCYECSTAWGRQSRRTGWGWSSQWTTSDWSWGPVTLQKWPEPPQFSSVSQCSHALIIVHYNCPANNCTPYISCNRSNWLMPGCVSYVVCLYKPINCKLSKRIPCLYCPYHLNKIF